MSACGGVGKAWRITLTGPGGAEVWDREGVFDATECATFTFLTPNAPGDYAWTFTYDGEAVPATNTPFRDGDGCGAPAVLIVSEEQPPLRERYYGSGGLAFGIDQFSAQAVGCDAAP
ncbi:MAG: hypothetical protein M5R40_14760 [Anaerolineae bacterium]|nr:hypothetical protein [Anaerolineae bacterium]